MECVVLPDFRDRTYREATKERFQQSKRDFASKRDFLDKWNYVYDSMSRADNLHTQQFGTIQKKTRPFALYVLSKLIPSIDGSKVAVSSRLLGFYANEETKEVVPFGDRGTYTDASYLKIGDAPWNFAMSLEDRIVVFPVSLRYLDGAHATSLVLDNKTRTFTYHDSNGSDPLILNYFRRELGEYGYRSDESNEYPIGAQYFSDLPYCTIHSTVFISACMYYGRTKTHQEILYILNHGTDRFKAREFFKRVNTLLINMLPCKGPDHDELAYFNAQRLEFDLIS